MAKPKIRRRVCKFSVFALCCVRLSASLATIFRISNTITKSARYYSYRTGLLLLKSPYNLKEAKLILLLFIVHITLDLQERQQLTNVKTN